MKRHQNFAIILLLFSSMSILLSCRMYYKQQGDRYYESTAYYKAAENFEKVVAKKEDRSSLTKLAYSYMAINEYRKAEDAYKRVLSYPSPDASTYMAYARMLMANGKHKEAGVQLNNYLKVKPNDSYAESLLRSVNNRSEILADSGKWALSQARIYGIQECMSPVVYKDGFVVTGTNSNQGGKANPQTGKDYFDLYFIKKDKKGAWGSPEPMQGSLKGNLHDGMAAFSPGGGRIFYTTSNADGLKGDDLYKDVIQLKIRVDSLIGGEWKKVYDFPYNSVSYSTGHPCLAQNGKVMYFISDMPGGVGGTDIYESRFQNGSWSKPKNLGPTVNSPQNEMFPSVDSAGNLYFSSYGRLNHGGLDVFMSVKSGDVFEPAENLGYPMNSPKDDFGILLAADGKTGLVTSNRDGSDKLYEFIRKEQKVSVSGIVSNKMDNKPLAGVNIEALNKVNNSIIKVLTNEDGAYNIELDGNTDYTFSLIKEGFFNQTAELSTEGKKGQIERDFIMEELIIDKPVVLEKFDDPSKSPIFFDFDKAEIRMDAMASLNKLYKLLQDNPKIIIEVSSHTDSRGDKKYNEKLSEQRAIATQKYLVEKGINISRIKAKGYGESKPVNKCSDRVECSDQEHQQNRRSEFKVIKIEK
jgi:outer membrane protein OmpA-like peptidoglycan-associated protein/tetratricopeptide (TPR) repeat protein